MQVLSNIINKGLELAIRIGLVGIVISIISEMLKTFEDASSPSASGAPVAPPTTGSAFQLSFIMMIAMFIATEGSQVAGAVLSGKIGGFNVGAFIGKAVGKAGAAIATAYTAGKTGVNKYKEKKEKDALDKLEKENEGVKKTQGQEKENAENKIKNAENDLAEAITKVSTSNQSISSASEKVKQTQSELIKAQENLANQNPKNTIKLTDSFVEVWKELADKHYPYNYETQKELFEKYKAEQSEKLKKIASESEALNQYKSNEQDKDRAIDFEKTTREQREELSLFANDLYNQVRKQIGASEAVVTKGMIDLSEGFSDFGKYSDFVINSQSFAFYTVSNLDEIQNLAKDFITEEVPTVEDAIEGAMLIIAQNISEKAEYRERIREIYLKSSIIEAKASKKAAELDEKKVYNDYYEYSEKIDKMASHRILAVNRGEKEDILTVHLRLEDSDREKIENMILKEFPKNDLVATYKEIIKDSLDRLIIPSIEREVRNALTERAEIESIAVFKDNLKNLLLQAPLKEKNVLALDPGYRTGCKEAVIDKYGFYRENTVFFLVEAMHNPKQIEDAKKKFLALVKKYEIDIVSIGNGTASRETETFVANIIKENKLNLKYLIVNEAGASVYSASKIAAEEFPDLDVTVRGAISIGRRIQDPLAELVKIDPKSIGVGMYQHDVNQSKLDESLDNVISHVVNNVGANINTASWALLSHISGIKKTVAKNIVEYRKENGNFKNRKEILKVKGVGPKAYEQMAGFLVIPEGENILDNTVIHPESYAIAEALLEKIGFSLEKYNNELNEARERLKSFDYKKFAEENNFGAETVKDVYEALLKDRRDPRDDFEKPLLKSDILNIDNLEVGMELEGTVRNVVKFGAFVDIGLKNDALLHISEISNKYIDDPSKVLAVGQIIKVRIKDVDKDRGRVGLTKKEQN